MRRASVTERERERRKRTKGLGMKKTRIHYINKKLPNN